MKFRSCVLASIVCLVTACSSSSSKGGGGGGGSQSGGAAVLGFTPSNVDLSGIDVSAADDVILNGTNCVIDGQSAEGPTSFFCAQDANNRVVHEIVTIADGSRLSVFVMKSLRIDAGTTILVNRGGLPIVFVALDTMVLAGSIQVAPGTTGGFANTMSRAMGAGAGGGTAGDSSGLAGGGASYCGLGGKGGTQTATQGNAPVAATPAFGNATLVPLVAGSAGGSSALINNGVAGGGGGAIELVAGTSFALQATGFVSAGGAGGVYGGLGKDGAGGGGSGGAILIESPVVTIDGKLAANGGGGGQGNGDIGENGATDAAAKGGHKMNEGAPGGDGSFGSTPNGADGPSSNDPTISASSGGGGAGRIRINTKSGIATVSGTLSPAKGTQCATEGVIAN